MSKMNTETAELGELSDHEKLIIRGLRNTKARKAAPEVALAGFTCVLNIASGVPSLLPFRTTELLKTMPREEVIQEIEQNHRERIDPKLKEILRSFLTIETGRRTYFTLVLLRPTDLGKDTPVEYEEILEMAMRGGLSMIRRENILPIVNETLSLRISIGAKRDCIMLATEVFSKKGCEFLPVIRTPDWTKDHEARNIVQLVSIQSPIEQSQVLAFEYADPRQG